jgi:hypothetical protein
MSTTNNRDNDDEDEDGFNAKREDDLVWWASVCAYGAISLLIVGLVIKVVTVLLGHQL